MIRVQSAVVATALALCLAPPAIAKDTGVNIIYPPHRATARAPVPPSSVKVINQPVTVAIIEVNTFRHRSFAVSPWRDWRWSGFDQSYSGPRFPF